MCLSKNDYYKQAPRQTSVNILQIRPSQCPSWSEGHVQTFCVCAPDVRKAEQLAIIQNGDSLKLTIKSAIYTQPSTTMVHIMMINAVMEVNSHTQQSTYIKCPL